MAQAVTETLTLETRLTNDPEGVNRDKLMQILQAFEQELDNKIKQGCRPDEYNQLNVIVNGARVAQVVLLDYHRHLNAD